jgi:phage protein D
VAGYQVLLDGKPAPKEFYPDVARLEVEENADLPDAICLELTVAAQGGELTWVGDKRVGPYANIAVVITPDGADPQCVFDGYVLGHKVRVPAGPAGATVEVYGQDTGVLMGLTETVREWSGKTDSQVAAEVFDRHHVTPAPANNRETAPAHTEQGHTLMQRASDLDFLRWLARRTGRWFRVYCAGTAGQRIGYFAAPDLDAHPVVTIDLNDRTRSSTPVLEFSWDVVRPTKVAARQASLSDSDQDGVGADTADAGLRALADRSLASFAGRDRTLILTAVADTNELPQRAAGVLREAAWFARCEGTTDLAALGRVLRVGDVVEVAGCGTLLSGKYLVWSVRHQLTAESDAMSFVLARNAVGPGQGTSAGGLASTVAGALGGAV